MDLFATASSHYERYGAPTGQLARTLGPFLFVLAAMAMVRASDMRAIVDEFAANSLWPWVLGAVNLLGGLIVIAFHQYWRSAAAIIVSVLGWLLALRGLFVLAFPQTSVSIAKNAIGAATLTPMHR